MWKWSLLSLLILFCMSTYVGLTNRRHVIQSMFNSNPIFLLADEYILDSIRDECEKNGGTVLEYEDESTNGSCIVIDTPMWPMGSSTCIVSDRSLCSAMSNKCFFPDLMCDAHSVEKTRKDILDGWRRKIPKYWILWSLLAIGTLWEAHFVGMLWIVTGLHGNPPLALFFVLGIVVPIVKHCLYELQNPRL